MARIEQGRTPVTLTMFDNKVHPGEMGLLANFFGPLGKRYFRNLFRNQLNVDHSTEGSAEAYLDAYFFQRIRDQYEYLSPGQEVEFYRSQLNRANKVIEYLTNTLALPKGIFSLRNEVKVFPDSPSQRLRQIADVNVSTVLRYETSRQMILAYLASPLDQRAASEKIQTRLFNFQDFLDKNLYVGKTGETEKRVIFSQHDNHTNTTLNFSFENHKKIKRKREAHLKKETFDVRKTNIKGIEVHTNMRHKGENESVIKSIMKAVKNHKPIDILESVRDSIGMKFAIMGDENVRDEFIAEFEEMVKKYRDFDRIEVDDSPNADRGQNQSSFKRRRQIYLKGLSIPIEVIFYSTPEYLDSEYEVGKDFKGKAHDLYDMRRLGTAAKILFMEEVYGVDIQPFIDQRLGVIADDLLYRNMIDEKTDEYV
jgi:hypothetical protein